MKVFITFIVCLLFGALIASPSWRYESLNNPDYSSNGKENHPLEESHLYLSSVLPIEEAHGIVAYSVEQNSRNNFRASYSVVDLGEPLNADVFNEPAQNETLPVNIGEPLDADSPFTAYTNETPVNLGELMNADDPIYSINDDLSGYQNIGPDMIVGEESDWRYVEPVDIGVTMDADN